MPGRARSSVLQQRTLKSLLRRVSARLTKQSTMQIHIRSSLPVSISVIGGAKSRILHCRKCLSPRELGQGSLVTQEAFSRVGNRCPDDDTLEFDGPDPEN
jgi:hypothetical protein